MPVVGKRYKHKHAPNLIVKPSGIENGRVLFKEYSPIAVCRFFDFYEELPDSDHIPDIGKKVGKVLKDNLQEIEEAQVENPWICTSCGLSFDECSNKVNEKANLVDRALEEVKQVLNEWSEIICFNRDLALPAIKLLWPAVKNLVKALEAEKNINCCANCGDKLGIIACKSSFKLGNFCSAKCADFNAFEQMQKDIAELKKKK